MEVSNVTVRKNSKINLRGVNYSDRMTRSRSKVLVGLSPKPVLHKYRQKVIKS